MIPERRVASHRVRRQSVTRERVSHRRRAERGEEAREKHGVRSRGRAGTRRETRVDSRTRVWISRRRGVLSFFSFFFWSAFTRSCATTRRECSTKDGRGD
jgi:hypothetical protein